MRFIDISNWQSDLNPDAVFPNVDAVVCKATEGLTFVDKYCDGFVQAAKRLGKPFGFYHYGRNNNATEEADFFIANCENYFHDGIPVLDWEENQNVEWVNEFVQRVRDKTGVWPWIYANPWRFDQGGVNPNCDRWVASYPNVLHPTFSDAENDLHCPDTNGLICAWQFCSDGYVDGYDGELDCNIYYGDLKSWNAYVHANPEGTCGEGQESGNNEPEGGQTIVVEDDGYRVMIEKK